MNERTKASTALILPIAVCALSGFFWLLMNVPFTPRFSLSPYRATSGIFVSLGLNALLGTVLLAMKRNKLAFIPFFFAMFPLAYAITAFTGHLILGSDFTGALFYRKILYDCYFFAIEMVCVSTLALVFGKNLHCLGFLKKPNDAKGFTEPVFASRPVTFLTVFSVLFFCTFVIGLMVLLLVSNRVPLSVIASLAWMQVLFAVCLGFKEELLFRWVLARSVAENLPLRRRSWAALAAMVIVALYWGVYHGFFGEGVGSGIASAAACFIASMYWGYLTFRNGSLRLGVLGHICIELYGFYLMYLPLLASMGYIR